MHKRNYHSHRESRRILPSKTEQPPCRSFAMEFAFCEVYDKVVYGMRHKLTLVRKSNDDAIFKIAAVAKGKVELTKVARVVVSCSCKSRQNV